MYHPYLRGKQFELIGLQDLIVPVFTPNKGDISPIIEPVRDSSTFQSTLKKLAENDINFTVIINPRVGDFVEKEPQKIFDILAGAISNYSNYQCGVIIDRQAQGNSLISLLENNNPLVKGLSLIHNSSFDNIIDAVQRFDRIAPVKYNILNHAFVNSRYRRSFGGDTLVQLNDYFQAQTRNVDYVNTPESSFSEEHLFYKDEGYIGYSDYTTIGEPYTESGFLPYAVAIHLSYPDSMNRIKVKHFVSDSNDDQSDIAGKFIEALDKLIDWCNETGYESSAVELFKDFHRRRHFPGLGTLKKLSMMNHIELVLKLIRR